MKHLLSIAAAGLTLAACVPPKGATTNVTDANLTSDATDRATNVSDMDIEPPQPDWTVRTSVDPMTDAVLTIASRTVLGDQVKLDVVVTCGASGMSYKFTGFDADGQPANFRHPFGLPVQWRFRVDRLPASYDMAYTNDFTNVVASMNSYRMFPARTVTLAMPFQHSDETFVIDQSEPEFQRAMSKCIIEARRELNPTPVYTPQPANAPAPAEPATVVTGGHDADASAPANMTDPDG